MKLRIPTETGSSENDLNLTGYLLDRERNSGKQSAYRESG